MDIGLIIGTTGAALVLLGFIMINTEKWNDKDIRFDAVNFLGSLLLFIYAVMGSVYPFMLLNAVWGLLSLRDVVKYFLKPKESTHSKPI